MVCHDLLSAITNIASPTDNMYTYMIKVLMNKMEYATSIPT